LQEAKEAKIVKMTLIGDSIFESFKGTTCSIPLKGLCEWERPDRRGCAKEADFKKFFSNEFAPPVNPQRKSMVPVTDLFPEYFGKNKPLILASAGMRFQDSEKFVQDLLDENFHSAVYFFNLGMNNLLDSEGLEVAKSNFDKLAAFLKVHLPYSVVMWHPVLPCEKCAAFGVNDVMVDELNSHMIETMTNLDKKGARRFWIVDCNAIFKKDEEVAENEMSEEAKEEEEMPPVQLYDDGRHPNLVGHTEWIKCWAPQLNKAVRAMEEANLTHSVHIETEEEKAERLAKEAGQMDEAQALAGLVPRVGPNGEIIYVTEEELAAEEAALEEEGNVTNSSKNNTNSTKKCTGKKCPEEKCTGKNCKKPSNAGKKPSKKR